MTPIYSPLTSEPSDNNDSENLQISHEHSHIYQNRDQFLLNYYTRPTSNKTKEKIEKIEQEITEEEPIECSSTNKLYQNIPKKPQLQKEKIWTIPLFLESPKSKQLQTPDLEKDF